MSQRIIDLDKIAPPDVVIRHEGAEYPLPGDPPVSVWLPLCDAYDRFSESDTDDVTDNLREFESRMLDLFRIRTPGLEALPIGAQQMFTVLIGIYNTEIGEVEEVPPPKGGTRSTSRKPAATRSRSSRS